jgi:uncharacterized metal-binding protein YceD (DUF177 family)
MKAELYRPLAVDKIGQAGLDVRVEASTAECSALASRMRLPAILCVACDFHLKRQAAGHVTARGRLSARLVQTCVISLEEFETIVREDFTIRFVENGRESQEIDLESDDEVPFQNGVLDLGEAAAQQLALSLDPYPRLPEAVVPEQDSELAESELTQFAAPRLRH